METEASRGRPATPIGVRDSTHGAGSHLGTSRVLIFARRTLAPVAALALALGGIVSWTSMLHLAAAVPAWASVLLVQAPAVALLLGWVFEHGPVASDGVLRRLLGGVRTTWPSLVAVGLVGAARLMPPGARSTWVFLTWFAAIAAAMLRPPPRESDRPIPWWRVPWNLATLLGTVCVAAYFLVIGSHAQGNLDNDSAYYYGVARHIALTGRWEEPILFHFLGPAQSVVHRPFDYWQGMTSLILLPFQAIRPGLSTALLTMAGVSAATVLLFWYLVVVAIPIRSRLVQLVALAWFSFSPAVFGYRFDTDSMAVSHIWLVLSLIAFARGRLVVAMVAGFLLMLTRGDGAIAVAFLWTACFAQVASNPEFRRKRIAILAGVVASLIGAYVVYHFAMFRTLGPPASAQVVQLTHFHDLFRFEARPALSGAAVAKHLREDFVADRARVALDTLQQVCFVPSTFADQCGEVKGSVPQPHQASPMLPLQLTWLALGLVMTFGLRTKPRIFSLLVAALTFVVPVVVSSLGSAVFVEWRTLHWLLPTVVLVGALGADELFVQLACWLESGGRTKLRVGAAALVVIGTAELCLSNMRPYPDRKVAPRRNIELALEELDGQMDGSAIASNLPWIVMAHTSSPAMIVPYNGEAAMEQAFVKFHIGWLVATGGYDHMDDSKKIMNQIAAGTRDHIGRLPLRAVSAPAGLRVYRVGLPEPP